MIPFPSPQPSPLGRGSTVRHGRPQPVVGDLSKAAVLFPSPEGEGQGEGKGCVQTLGWDHPISIALGVLSLRPPRQR